MLKKLKKIFLKNSHISEYEKKKTCDRTIHFKGGKPTKFQIGDHTYINGLTIYSWGELSTISIGKYCSIADEVSFIAGGEHHKDWVSTFPFSDRWRLNIKVPNEVLTKGNIAIGHDVWIGNGVTVLSGVTIGNGAIIGANAVVAKDIPPYAIVVGNPAKVIKYRFSQKVVLALLRIEWWNWAEEEIIAAQLLFSDTEEFVKKFDQVNSSILTN